MSGESITWKMSLEALSWWALKCKENCVPMPGYPKDEITLARLEGKRLAYTWIIDQCEKWTKYTSPQGALKEIRRLLAEQTNARRALVREKL